MKSQIDIEPFLELQPLEKSAFLYIKPLAPLSMVDSLPGSYYKTEKIPTFGMICGLLENIIGFHFEESLRDEIIKNYFKKKNIPTHETESGFKSIITNHFKISERIKLRNFKSMHLFEDYWTQHMIGSDVRHAKGSTRYDWKLEEKVNQLKLDIKAEKTTEKELDSLFKSNKSCFPHYYRSVNYREFLVLNGEYEIRLSLSSYLLGLLFRALEQNNLAYLGTSEGWVDCSLEEIHA